MAIKGKFNEYGQMNLWTQKDSATLGLNTLASIKMRTSKGIDSNGRKFKRYSTRPLYVAYNSDTGRRLTPLGGQSTIGGRFYSGGYAEYKRKSRKRSKSGVGQSASVDLVLSGQLINNFVLKSSSSSGFTLGLTQHVAQYGYDVNSERSFIGLTNKEVDILLKAVELDLIAKLGATR